MSNFIGIIRIIRPNLTESHSRKKYFFNEDDINNEIDRIKKKGLEITINEVCRQLGCTKFFFRNKPALKSIIIKEKNKQQTEIQNLLPNHNDPNHLSSEAENFEPIFLNYKEEMERMGKNWKSSKNNLLAEKLGIPFDYFMEIKMKYCYATRKKVKKRNKKTILQQGKHKKEICLILSPEAKQYEAIFLKWLEERTKLGINWKLSKNITLSEKMNIPLNILIELKKFYIQKT